jgi:hypothetical protein
MVTEAYEQVGGSDKAPGMTVRPRLDGDAATWWKSRVALPDVVKVEAAPVVGIVRSKRASNTGAVPELVDDGRNTAQQEAVDPAKLGVEAEKATQTIPTLPDLPLVDDGRATTAMDAIDLAALGLDAATSSGSIPTFRDDTDDESSPSDSKSGGTKKKRRRR